MHKWIELLKLERHVEGGYFGIFYKSSDKVITLDEKYSYQSLMKKNDRTESPQDKDKIERHAGSSIYFLLEKEDFSAWHRLNSDEIWHYYDGGSPIDIYIIDQNGILTTQTLGNPLFSEDASFQVVIKAGDWFAAEVRDKSSFALMGCTVSPGFEYCDFTLADRNMLVMKYSQHAAIINKLTRTNTAVTSDLLITETTASISTSSCEVNSLSSSMHIDLKFQHPLVSDIGLYSRSSEPEIIDQAMQCNIM